MNIFKIISAYIIACVAPFIGFIAHILWIGLLVGNIGGHIIFYGSYFIIPVVLFCFSIFLIAKAKRHLIISSILFAVLLISIFIALLIFYNGWANSIAKGLSNI
jgi:hypothetical protein